MTRAHAPLLLCSLLMVACHSVKVLDGDTAAPDTQNDDALFAPDHILEVEVEMDPADLDTLLHQKRNIMEELSEGCLDGPINSPFTWFPATVTIDGQRFESVGVRKKGLLGSESSTRPSFKVNLDEYIDGQQLMGRDDFTFNNAQQDPTILDQCLGYGLFTAAGVPASRCNFAHVVSNGVDAGLYVHVEPIKKDFLRRHFDDDEGNLYEGTLSDFRADWVNTFDRKTNEDDLDRSDLELVVDALSTDDDTLLAALDEAVDLDGYLTFWAMEVLLGHWDGYAGNTNNFYIYRDPTDARFHFIPWGIDALFDSSTPFGATRPSAVVAAAALPRRLYLHPEGQALYVERLRTLLDTVWDEEAILAEVDRLQALVEPWMSSTDLESFTVGVQVIRDYVATRRANLEAELDPTPPAWEYELSSYPCLSRIGAASCSFSTQWSDWSDAAVWDHGSAELSLELDGWQVPFRWVAPTVVPSAEDPSMANLAVLGAYDASTYLMVYMSLPAASIVTGADLPIDWNEVTAWLYYLSEVETGGEWAQAAYLYDGTLHIDQAGEGEGEPVSGDFEMGVWGG